MTLQEIETELKEWLEELLKTHVDYKSDMPFNLEFVAQCIWEKIKDNYIRLIDLEKELENRQLQEMNNKPLTIEEIKELPCDNDWIWIECTQYKEGDKGYYYQIAPKNKEEANIDFEEIKI